MPTIGEIREKFPMYADVPEGELVRGIHRKFYADMPYQEFLRGIDFRQNVDPTADMSGGERFLAGTGKAFTDIGRGARQLVSSDAPTMSGLVTGDKRGPLQQEVDESRALDKPLMATGAGMAGNLAGNMAAFLPTAFVPGANTFTGAALAGGAMGALQPTSGNESRAANAGLGAVAGLGGQAVGSALGRALRPVASKLSPEAEALAQAAQREGVPLTAGQRTGSRPLQVAESVMENLPFTSGSQLAGREAQQRAFTAAALRKAGIAGDAATPEVLAGQRAALGGTMGNIAKANTLDFNKGLADRLANIAGEAGVRGPEAAKPIETVIDRILAEVGQGGAMPGTVYQAWRQRLRPLASGGGPESHYYGQIRKALDEAFNAQMEAAGSEAWKGANRQYANLKTIMQAAGGPGAPAAANQLAPAQLSAALRQAMGKEGVALGRGDLNDLTRIGQTFVKPLPDSFTSQRSMMTQLLQGSLPGAGAGGIYGAMTDTENPMAGALKGGAAGLAAGGAAALLTPRAIQAAMNSKLGQKYLTEGAVALTEGERKALSSILRGAAIGGVPAYLGAAQ